MGLLFYLSAWTITAIAADYTFHKHFCPDGGPTQQQASNYSTNHVNIKSDQTYTNYCDEINYSNMNSAATIVTTVQTMTWRYSSQPHSLLFDFSGSRNKSTARYL